MQSLSYNNYNQLAASDSRNLDYVSPNPDGFEHLKKKKIANFLNTNILPKQKSNSNSRDDSRGQESGRSRSPLPNIN